MPCYRYSSVFFMVLDSVRENRMLVSKYESRKGENDFSRFRLFFFI